MCSLIINEPHKPFHELACEMCRARFGSNKNFTSFINNDQLKIVYEDC